MRNAVVIKSSKAGMTVILDPELPFDELLDAIGKKFSESARFWGSVQMTLTLEGRDLTAAQELSIRLRRTHRLKSSVFWTRMRNGSNAVRKH